MNNFVNKKKIVNLVHLLKTSTAPKGFAFVDKIHHSFIISVFLFAFGLVSFWATREEEGKKSNPNKSHLCTVLAVRHRLDIIRLVIYTFIAELRQLSFIANRSIRKSARAKKKVDEKLRATESAS